MGVVTKPYTFNANTTIQSAQANADFDSLYSEFNGNIENANIKASAGISESKLAFNTTSGHRHNGVDSRLVAVNRAFAWYVSGILATGVNQSVRYIVPQNLTIVKAWLIVRTAPTTQPILIDINKNGTTIWTTQGNRGSIAAGATSGSTTTFDITALSAGDYLDLDIDQVGSGTTGVDLTVVLECSQP